MPFADLPLGMPGSRCRQKVYLPVFGSCIHGLGAIGSHPCDPSSTIEHVQWPLQLVANDIRVRAFAPMQVPIGGGVARGLKQWDQPSACSKGTSCE